MKLKSHHFYVAYRILNQNDLPLYLDKTSLREFKLIKNPMFCWCADPFPFIYNNKKYIFAEVASRLRRKGKIGFVCLDDKNPKWKICCKNKFHMSFPNILKCDNKLYMIPETYQDGGVYSYLCTSFPFEWEKTDTIFLNNFAVDTIPLYKDGELAQFATYLDNKGLDKELVFFNKNGGDVVHRFCDTEKIYRPAGNFIDNCDGTIYPHQLNSKYYGYGIRFSLVDLTNFTVKKELCEIICEDVSLAFANGCGIHTYNIYSNIETIDILKNEFSFLGLLYKVISKVKGIIK